MSMALVTVFGATGQQGGSVIDFLLKDGQYNVRGVTRNPNKEEALALSKRGVEVVEGDLADLSSITKAVDGAEFVFVVTQAWEHFDKELDHGLNAIKALTGSSTLKQVVFSGLENPHEYDVPHFKFKHEIEEAFKKSGLPYTFVHAAFYLENFLQFFKPQKQGQDAIAFAVPLGDDKFGCMAVEDYGAYVLHVMKNYKDYLGKTLLAVPNYVSLQEVLDAFSKASGRNVVDAHVSLEEFAQLPFPGAAELSAMFGYLRKYQPYKDADREARKIFPQAQTVSDWVVKSGFAEKLKSL